MNIQLDLSSQNSLISSRCVKNDLLHDFKPSLLGVSRDALAAFLRAHGVKENHIKMRVSQIWNWLYVHGVQHFDEMKNVSKAVRALLRENFSFQRPEIIEEQISKDGTRKWLMRFPALTSGERPVDIETVYIPESDRGTLCVSSQVGCTLNCTFCHTGTQRLVRNLTQGEILAQILLAKDRLHDWPHLPALDDNNLPSDSHRLVTNIVMMGMGEPLYNYDHVKSALLIALDPDGLAFSKRRITLSTSGIVPMIEKCGEEIGVGLAISLHAVRNDLRNELVPLNKKYPIEVLLQACRDYKGASNTRRITFEYVMLKGVNDSLEEARELVRLLKGIPAKINLIPFNPWPNSPYECSEWDVIERFSDVVYEAGYASPIRTPRGRDIFAACGQLKSESEKVHAKDRHRLLDQA